jgi:tRNA A37 threonylcarbamoyladenosine biosynthesis protein TsaE
VSGSGIVAIEWAERWRGRPNDAIAVAIDDRGENRRRIQIKNDSSASA